MTRYKTILLLLVLAGTLAGCTNFFYNRLDTLAAWYVQDLVSLDDSQRNDLRTWLNETLQWHRRSELIRYAKFLRELAATSEQPGNASTYKSVEAQVEGFGARLVEQAAPDAARLMMSLTPEQIDELEASLAEKARERSEKNLAAQAEG